MKTLSAYALTSMLLLPLAAKALESNEKALETNEFSLDPEMISVNEATLGELAADVGELPNHRSVKGERQLLCIGVKYRNLTKVVSQENCQKSAEYIADFYGRNSRGLLQIKASSLPAFEIDMLGSKAAYTAAVQLIKEKYPTYDFYVIPGIYTYPHASGKVAHVISEQYMTATHEVGHLIGLGHAGVYRKENGQMVYIEYGDTDSIMGRVISKYITAPQFYYLGWLRADEVASYDPQVEFYDLRTIGAYKQKGLATVVISPLIMKENGMNQDRFAFVSRSNCEGNTCISLHLLKNGSSQKVAEDANEIYDPNFTGLHIKLLGTVNNNYRVSIDFDQKP